MANANQVIVNGETILDLRSDTVTPETLQKGYTAHDKSGTKITGTLEASSVSVQPTKSITITSNGTATITPDAGYDAMSSVDVTVNVASGGGGGAGFKVTFPATANNWGRIYAGDIVQVDGTVIDVLDYSTLAGKTIPNVLEICIWGGRYCFPRMTVQTGKIMLTYFSPTGVYTSTAVDGESTMVYMNNGATSRWIPLADTVISAIELINTD